MIIRQAIFRVVLTATTQKTLNSMTRRDRIVFLLLDGKRTIHDIALLIHRTEPDVTGYAGQLVEKRLCGLHRGKWREMRGKSQ